MRRQSFPAATFISAAAAKAHIARLLLQPPNAADAQLGSVTLLRYQLEGAARLRGLLARQRGALLADEVGLGKTYTALAVARHFTHVEIVVPATLRSMWRDACARSGVVASFVSSESLSRAPPAESAPDLVIVDEAHWFRNAATRRYRNLARRCRASRVLLLSATPLHNRAADLAALLALFLGVHASRLAPNEIAELTVRRGRLAVADEPSHAAPRVQKTCWWRLGCSARVVAALDALETPVPPRHAGVAPALLRLTLLRRLSSSDAALRQTLQRMLARALALLDAARGGSYPTARELCSWLVADEAVQLALPGLMVAIPNETVSLDSIERHVASLRRVIAALDSARSSDARRAAALATLLRRFPEARIVAFSQYDATVRALARKLRDRNGIATLSGKGARIASGTVSRAMLLQQFDAAGSKRPVHPAMHVRLLLTTDLLSEGVNLHNANVVVHLDVPWTAARLEQRVGRLSRIGSPHSEVHVYGFAPPKALELAQRLVARLRAKWEASRRRFGESALLGGDPLVTRPRAAAGVSGAYARDKEALRRVLADWLRDPAPDPPIPFVAQVELPSSQHPLAVALIHLPRGPQAVAVEGSARISMNPAIVLRVANELRAARDAHPADHPATARVLLRLERNLARMRGADAVAVGLGTPAATLHALVARATKIVARGRRPRALALAAGIRQALQRILSAGDQALLGERSATLIAHARTAEPLCWLERTHKELLAAFPDPASDMPLQGAGEYRVIGILMAR